MTRIPEPEQTPLGPAYEGRLLARPDDEVVDQGAGFDIRTLVSRRGVLSLVGLGLGTVALAACGVTGTDAAASPSGTAAAGTADGEIPDETNGPYPADGTNGQNVLEESGIVRSDITTSIGGSTPVDGVPLSMTFTVTDMASGSAPFAGVAVYAWQCDAQGRYSMYSEGVENETFLRGIQVADAQGQVTFQTIVPGCYTGRWTHIHFEVYPDVDSATNGQNAIATSQVAFPQDMLETLYALDVYPDSARNLQEVGSLDNDNVFGDGYDLQLGTFTGDADAGYTGSLAVGVDTTTEPSMGAAPSGGGAPGGQGGMPSGAPSGGPGGGQPPAQP
ncbi:intradiol ring-cleavage dioxygenase [Microbacterium fluvii]|uniref:Intradiol ring-cleavage dioxygenase n=1 Tax=Microbacterium fluvii TaxID=415215 RepID=A0ABW2HK06_9MICO|nr:intradiol ring-cleavage dioxygenase [Microbacterium fluvii]MCU4673815.1 intradiol ring-cleavage dioxygenase [Microbacterium fluvii]